MVCIAYGPADATATLSSLASVKSRMVYLSRAGLPRLSWKKGHLTYTCVCVVTCVNENLSDHCRKSIGFPVKQWFNDI